MELPKDFTKNILEVYGDDGAVWLKDLPEQLSLLSRKWNLQSLKTVKNLSYNFVAQAVLMDGRRVILKMGPAAADYAKEISWLSSYKGLAPEVVEFDKDLNVFFMEELSPGGTLQNLPFTGKDDEATRVVARLIRGMYVGHSASTPQSIPHIADLISSFRFLEGQVDRHLLEKGRSLYQDLSQPSSDDVFLHGDLHHDNILLAGEEWKIIDPHGYVGDKVSEVGSMIYNPLEWYPEGSMKKAIARRLDILCEELPFDAQRIRAWALSKTMLSIAWSFEGGQVVPPHELAIAVALNELIS